MDQRSISDTSEQRKASSLPTPRRGYTHSPETRAKISAAGKGKYISLEARAKMSAARTGLPSRLKIPGHPLAPDGTVLYSTEELIAHTMPEPNTGCWIWLRKLNENGYGIVAFGRENYASYAHRSMWVACYGPIKDGLCVLHHCDTPSCINPSHLFLGTRGDNAKDRQKKGRGRGEVMARGGKRKDSSAWRRGENHGRAVLSEQDVLAIRAARKSGTRTGDLARHYKVSNATIYAIDKRINWKYLK